MLAISPLRARVWYRPPVPMFGWPGAIPALLVRRVHDDPAHVVIGVLRSYGEGRWTEATADVAHLAARTSIRTVDLPVCWRDHLDEAEHAAIAARLACAERLQCLYEIAEPRRMRARNATRHVGAGRTNGHR